jgi:Zn finger protein HypA/HybF involved in hydrogenase expression
MPRPSDPAPCKEGEDLYECRECRNRLCSEERLISCPECDAELQNLTRPRPE